MPRHSARLAQALDQLEILCGKPRRPIPRLQLGWILWKNVAYLVDDEQCEFACEALERGASLAAAKITSAPNKARYDVTQLGGMHAEQRVDRMKGIADLALEHGGGDLSQVLGFEPTAGGFSR